MSNPAWQKGVSGNPQGRPRKKRSSEPIARLIERFVARNLTPRKLQQIYDKLEAKDRLLFMVDLLPYAVSKKPTQAQIGISQLPDAQLNELYNQVMASIDTDEEIQDVDHEEVKLLPHAKTG